MACSNAKAVCRPDESLASSPDRKGAIVRSSTIVRLYTHEPRPVSEVLSPPRAHPEHSLSSDSRRSFPGSSTNLRPLMFRGVTGTRIGVTGRFSLRRCGNFAFDQAFCTNGRLSNLIGQEASRPGSVLRIQCPGRLLFAHPVPDVAGDFPPSPIRVSSWLTTGQGCDPLASTRRRHKALDEHRSMRLVVADPHLSQVQCGLLITAFKDLGPGFGHHFEAAFKTILVRRSTRGMAARSRLRVAGQATLSPQDIGCVGEN